MTTGGGFTVILATTLTRAAAAPAPSATIVSEQTAIMLSFPSRTGSSLFCAVERMDM
jgi:hypothetical protein